jgi:hypothetical protein
MYCHVFEGSWLQTGCRLDTGFTDHLYTPLGTTLYRPLKHTLVSLVYYSIHQTFPGNAFYRGRFFSFPHLGPLLTASVRPFLAVLLSTLEAPLSDRLCFCQLLRDPQPRVESHLSHLPSSLLLSSFFSWAPVSSNWVCLQYLILKVEKRSKVFGK